MTWNAAASGSSGLFQDGFGWGGVLLVIGMVLALAVVSGLGILARMRDRASQRQSVAGDCAPRDHGRSDTTAAG